MAKFSLFADGDEDGDAAEPSSPPRKRSRLSLSCDSSTPIPPSSAEPQPQVDDEQQSDDEEEEEEEEEEEDQHEDSDPIPNDYPLARLSPRRLRSFMPGGDGLRSPLVDRDGEAETRAVAIDGDRSISVCLSDPDVLDCCICFEPLTIPVFQCENGHTACSSCCTKLRNKCPTCSWPIGYNRCRAIEKVLESVKIACQNKQYGCNEVLTYSKKKDHNDTCTYSPCSCPFSVCNFISSSKQLYQHFVSQHSDSDSAFRFQYNRKFTVTVNANKEFLILLERYNKVPFILRHSVEDLGSVVWLSCISPNKCFEYNIYATNGGHTLTLQSATTCSQGQLESRLPAAYLLVPSDFLVSPSQLKLHIEIIDD